MKFIRLLICCFLILLAVSFSPNISNAKLWDITDYNDGIRINDSAISKYTNFPYGIMEWFIRYGAEDTDVYNPMFREWFWFRIGDQGKQTSLDKLPVTGFYNSNSSAATLTYTDTQSLFKAIITFQVIGKPEHNYNSTFNKNITIQNTTMSDLDFHLYAYNDLDVSEIGTDNIAIIKGERAIQTGLEGRVLIQTSTLKPSHFDIDTLYTDPGSSLDLLENGANPLALSDYSGPFPENGDMQFVFQYDLKIPAGESASFVITDKIVQTNPLVISNAQIGGSCAEHSGNATYNICFNNTTNAVGAKNVVVTVDFKNDATDLSGTYPFISATDGGVYDPVKKTIVWTFPNMAKDAQQCVQATVGVNTTKAFTAEATIYSDETFPAQVSVTTPLCNYPPSVTSIAPSDAITGMQYVYQITASDVENDPLTFTLTQAPPGMYMDATGRITWIPASQQHNAYFPVGVDISDGHSVIHNSFLIYVKWQNQAPSAPVQQTASAVINKSISYQVLATDPDNQVLTFTTTDNLPAWLTMSSGGILSGIPTALGTYSINVTIADPLGKTTSTKLNVNVTAVAPPQTPIITWVTPAAINYGTALSGTQLNATANVPGSFAYTPASGTVLPAGNSKLSVVFTPADSTNYTVQSTSVTLVVASNAVPSTYSVTPTKIGSGSSITPSSVQLVNSGATASFTVSADEGYGISITGCGGALDNNVYTTANVTGNCSVTVTAVRRNGNGGGSAAPIMADALKALQGVVGAQQLTDEEKIRYDVAPLNANGNPRGNGVVDFADVILILRRSIGMGSW